MNDSFAGSAPQGQSRSLDPLKLKSKARLRYETDEDVCGLQKKEVAFFLQTSDAQLTRYCGDQYGDDLPAHKVVLVTRKFGPGYMEWLAEQCGGVYHHGEARPTNHQPITVLVGLLARQSGSTIQQIIQDLSDRKWTPQERQADLPGLRKLQEIVATMIQIAEGGDL